MTLTAAQRDKMAAGRKRVAKEKERDRLARLRRLNALPSSQKPLAPWHGSGSIDALIRAVVERTA